MRAYTVQSGDWLRTIAVKELGNENRWKEITKDSEGKQPFTEKEAEGLKIGDTVYLPN